MRRPLCTHPTRMVLWVMINPGSTHEVSYTRAWVAGYRDGLESRTPDPESRGFRTRETDDEYMKGYEEGAVDGTLTLSERHRPLELP
jgi:hypothetical protein